MSRRGSSLVQGTNCTFIRKSQEVLYHCLGAIIPKFRMQAPNPKFQLCTPRLPTPPTRHHLPQLCYFLGVGNFPTRAFCFNFLKIRPTVLVYSFSPSSQIIDSLEQDSPVMVISIFLKLTTYLAIGGIVLPWSERHYIACSPYIKGVCV